MSIYRKLDQYGREIRRQDWSTFEGVDPMVRWRSPHLTPKRLARIGAFLLVIVLFIVQPSIVASPVYGPVLTLVVAMVFALGKVDSDTRETVMSALREAKS